MNLAGNSFSFKPIELISICLNPTLKAGEFSFSLKFLSAIFSNKGSAIKLFLSMPSFLLEATYFFAAAKFSAQ